MGILTLDDVTKTYGQKKVLSAFSYHFNKGRIYAVTGPSGSGKTTLLNIIGLLESPDNGDVILMDRKVRPSSRQAMLALRHTIGYLFQNFALIDNKTVKENLMVAITYRKNINRDKLISQALDQVGLPGFERKMIYQCSGGEQQRIAIARLLLKPCQLILADEPTGSLDEENKHIIFNLLKMLNEKGKTIIIVSHDPAIIELCHQTIPLTIREGICNKNKTSLAKKVHLQ